MKAEDILVESEFESDGFQSSYIWSVVIDNMKKYAKVKVEEALNLAYQNAELKELEYGSDEQVCFMSNDMGDAYVLDKESIFNVINKIKFE
jgi:hypothetical protein